MKKYCSCIIFACVLISSCQVKHLTTTHNTPYFTKGNQFEGGLNFGLAGGQLNLAYTPVKYLAMQLNACSFLSHKYTYQYINRSVTEQYFCNYAEVVIGGYYPLKKSLFALNIGYGEGATEWFNNSPLGESGYTLYKAKFDSKNTFLHLYYAMNKDSGKLIHGFSCKLSSYTDKYYYGSSSNFDFKLSNKIKNTQNIEMLYFVKLRLAKHIYLNLTAGPQIPLGYTEGENTLFITRFGIVIR
jgi:hypothetical protein